MSKIESRKNMNKIYFALNILQSLCALNMGDNMLQLPLKQQYILSYHLVIRYVTILGNIKKDNIVTEITINKVSVPF